ncbi:hypothetical protein AX14_012446 [Amanita brunnescens Koide BX004]|nr:hypothetical protein AX14_012446 [Amanita brunnescens Koide BX004]
MFSLPVPEGTRADGSSDDTPLKLDGVVAIDFIRLLKYLFTTKRSFDLHGYSLKTLDEWTSVFKLAGLWDMTDVKAEAIQRMTPLLEKTPGMQVKLSLEYGVEEWLVPGLNRLAQREEPLNRDDVELIGLDYALKVMALREDCRPSSSGWTFHRRGEISMDFSKQIKTRFSIRQ